MKQEHIFILSGPAGVGKSSTIDFLLNDHPDYIYIPTYTTRSPRKDELNNKTRVFISEEEFKKIASNDELVEWEKVHDYYYVGKKKADIRNALENNLIPIIDIDVKGIKKYKETFNNIHLIFMQYRDLSDLKERILKSRLDCSEEELKIRYQTALKEMEYKNQYDYVITTINGQSPSIPAKEIGQIIKNTLDNQLNK